MMRRIGERLVSLKIPRCDIDGAGEGKCREKVGFIENTAREGGFY